LHRTKFTHPLTGEAMFSIPEQFSAQFSAPQFPQFPQFQTQLQSQLNFANTVAAQAVESAGKIAALNLHTAKASVEKSSNAAQQLLSAKDPQEFFSLASAQPASFERLVEYGRELWAIAQDAQAELVKAATEGKDAPAAALKLSGPA